MQARLANLRHIVFDMDGTIYLGSTIFDDTLPFLELLRRLNIGYSFVTNNCSHSRAEYVAKLRRMGIEAPADSVVTSSHAAIHYLKTHLPQVRRLFVLGSPGGNEDLALGGFTVVEDTPDAVVVAFDRDLDYDRLCRTAYLLKQGLPYIATHPDKVCPTNEPTVLPDCAAICALLETATGRKPEAIPGKPNPEMLQAVLDRHSLRPDETAMIGDRLYTDVRMARDAGVLAILTLTGEASAAEAEQLPPQLQPNLIVNNLTRLAQHIAASHK